MKIPKSNRIKARYLLATLLLTGLGSQPAWALDCTPKTGALTINVGNIIVQKDTANLTVLSSAITSSSSGYDCKNNSSNNIIRVGVMSYSNYMAQISSYLYVFATNVAGIGFAIGAEGDYALWVGYTGTVDWFGSNWVSVSGRLPGGDYNLPLIGKIQLFKTGELSSGALSGQIGALIVGNPSLPTAYGPEIPIYITGTVTKIACSLNSTSINIPLGDISATRFTGIASTTGDKGFNVGLSCDKDAKINVALAGTQNSDTTDTSVLALTNAGQTGTATGVGVQLLYGGVPLKINNNILLKTSPGGQETLPFTARYYQTQATVGAGLANSSATLNITYQ